MVTKRNDPPTEEPRASARAVLRRRSWLPTPGRAARAKARGSLGGARGSPNVSLSVLLVLAPALAGADKLELAELGQGVGLTVYNQDFAIVRERRVMPLAAGRSEVKFKDVAATIVPESVHFRSLRPADGATVIEQNYEFDLVSASKLLDKYIDKPISIITRDGDLLEGTLMSFDDAQLVLSARSGVELVPRGKNVKDIRFSALPGGLLTRPTLVWLVDARQAGDHLVQVAYRANRVNWRVDYRAVADPDGNMLDLSGWVTVTNRSGRTYQDARLKLMAGDVHIVEPESLGREVKSLRQAGVGKSLGVAGFEEKTFAEYHLYELPRPTTIKDKQTKQIELIDVTGVPVTRKYQYRGEANKVHVMLEFKNAKKTHDGLGIPLPKGPIRVYRKDADAETEFIGSDAIDHTPKDEPVKVKVGDAFEIKAERTQTDNREPARRVNDQDWRIRLRNHKDVPVQVEVLETLQRRRANWEILKTSHEFTKKDYRTIVFEVDVPANGEVVVTYTVRYWW